MGQLDAKFLKWLEERFPDTRGNATALANALGKQQSQISRWRGAWREDPDLPLPAVDLSALECLARYQDLAHVWQLVREIERQRVDRRAEPVPITLKQRQEWEGLFVGKPELAGRVLMNLRHAEALGYTDLVCQVARLIIRHGPQGAAGPVAGLLAATEEVPSSHRTKLRKKLMAEYGDSPAGNEDSETG